MSDEYPVYLTTEPAPIEQKRAPRATVGSDAAFKLLDGGLLRRHLKPEGSLMSSEAYLEDLTSILGGKGELKKWGSVIKMVTSLTVVLTHLFSGKKGLWLGKNLKSRGMLGTTQATGTGAGDDAHQKTAGFIFMLGHFGHPFDLKHLSVYGKESKFPGWRPGQQESYAQRRFVCLDADVALYESGLVMIHDAVWPRHLMGKQGTLNKGGVNLTCEATYEDVSTGERLRGLKEEYDPHQETNIKNYFRAETLYLRNRSQTTVLRPLDSIVAGSCFREAVALEVVRFATLLEKQPGSLEDVSTLIQFINEWIRPQVMLPWEVEVPGNDKVQEFDLWGLLDFPKERTSAEVEQYLSEHYKKVGDKWQEMLRLSSRKVDGALEKETPFKAPYYTGVGRQAAKGGLRAFGWPKQKYTRKDVRTIGAEMTTDLKATGDRSEYQTLWNGLPELAAYSACLKREVTLNRDHVNRPSTVIHPFTEGGGKLSLKWNKLPVKS